MVSPYGLCPHTLVCLPTRPQAGMQGWALIHAIQGRAPQMSVPPPLRHRRTPTLPAEAHHWAGWQTRARQPSMMMVAGTWGAEIVQGNTDS